MTDWMMFERKELESKFIHSVIIAQLPNPMDLWRLQQELQLSILPNFALVVLVDIQGSRTRVVSDRQKFTLRQLLTKALHCEWPSMLTHWHEDLECVALLTKEKGVEVNTQTVMEEVRRKLSNIELPFGVTMHAGISHVVDSPVFLPSCVRFARSAARFAKRTGKQVCHEEDIELYEVCILDEIKTEFDTGEPVEQTGSQMIQNAIQFIMAHLNEELELEKIAAYCLVSHYYLSHLFRRETGTTVTAFIKKARIDKAMELLRRGDYTVADVAYQVGYQDPNYFSKSFRTYVGMTPTEYRRKIL